MSSPLRLQFFALALAAAACSFKDGSDRRDDAGGGPTDRRDDAGGGPTVADSGTTQLNDAAADAAEASACDRSRPFEAPIDVAGLATFGVEESVVDLRLSPDQLTGYFGRRLAYNPYELYTARRHSIGEAFQDATPIATGLHTPAGSRAGVSVRGDGLVLVYGRLDESPAQPSLQWAKRSNISAPFADIETTIASNAMSPFLREDGNALYFTAVREAGNWNIYRAGWNGTAFTDPQVVSELNTSSTEVAPVITPDELMVFFASDRSDRGARGASDIWMATRASVTKPFGAPKNISELNTPHNEFPSFVSRDGCTLYFHSDLGTYGGYRVYAASRPRPL